MTEVHREDVMLNMMMKIIEDDLNVKMKLSMLEMTHQLIQREIIQNRENQLLNESFMIKKQNNILFHVNFIIIIIIIH